MAIPYTPTWNAPFPAPMPTFPANAASAVQPTIQPVNGIVKVSGRASAEAYLMPPNSTSPALFDESGKTFYIKTTDGAGVGTVEAFDYQEHVEEEAPAMVAGVSREEFDELSRKVDSIIEERANVKVPGPVQQSEAKPAEPARQDAVDGSGASGRKPVSVGK